MYQQYILIVLCSTAMFGNCQNKTSEPIQDELMEGRWGAQVEIQEQELPFIMEFKKQNEEWIALLINGKEKIEIQDLEYTNDSLWIPMHIFDASIVARVDRDFMKGAWVKHYADNYIIPFEATYGNKERFSSTGSKENADFSGKWKVTFEGPERSKLAIGLFEQQGRKITGTFLTSTGDYRYLAGIVDNKTMKLSTFDGSHAYLFEADLMEDGTIRGDFWSGKSWHQTWQAERDPEFELPDPYELTPVDEVTGPVTFSFPNEDGEIISLEDEIFKNKVVLIQILGTWCPNCMDETKFLSKWYDKNKSRGAEIIGLAFESKPDPEYAMTRVKRMREKLGVSYPVLIAGTTEKASVKAAMPWLEKLKSYPTSIYLDRNHEVVKIHTGFSGPGTGEYYDHFVEEFNTSMDLLLDTK